MAESDIVSIVKEKTGATTVDQKVIQKVQLHLEKKR